MCSSERTRRARRPPPAGPSCSRAAGVRERNRAENEGQLSVATHSEGVSRRSRPGDSPNLSPSSEPIRSRPCPQRPASNEFGLYDAPCSGRSRLNVHDGVLCRLWYIVCEGDLGATPGINTETTLPRTHHPGGVGTGWRVISLGPCTTIGMSMSAFRRTRIMCYFFRRLDLNQALRYHRPSVPCPSL